jgi:hypothetical protein
MYPVGYQGQSRSRRSRIALRLRLHQNDVAFYSSGSDSETLVVTNICE